MMAIVWLSGMVTGQSREQIQFSTVKEPCGWNAETLANSKQDEGMMKPNRLNAIVASCDSEEPHIGIYSCDNCLNNLTGDRYTISYRERLPGCMDGLTRPSSEVFKAEVCPDCMIDLCS